MDEQMNKEREMSKEPEKAETKAEKIEAHHPPPPPVPVPSNDLLIALLATDWLRGDKRHFDVVLSKTRALLKQIGPEGADALAELDGLKV